jgi:hypothetical protein
MCFVTPAVPAGARGVHWHVRHVVHRSTSDTCHYSLPPPPPPPPRPPARAPARARAPPAPAFRLPCSSVVFGRIGRPPFPGNAATAFKNTKGPFFSRVLGPSDHHVRFAFLGRPLAFSHLNVHHASSEGKHHQPSERRHPHASKRPVHLHTSLYLSLLVGGLVLGNALALGGFDPLRVTCHCRKSGARRS